MTFLYYFVYSIYYLLCMYLNLMVIDIVLSWIPPLHRFKIVRFLDYITDAYMGIFHGFLTIGFLDFTPVVGFLIYEGMLQAIAMLLS